VAIAVTTLCAVGSVDATSATIVVCCLLWLTVKFQICPCCHWIHCCFLSSSITCCTTTVAGDCFTAIIPTGINFFTKKILFAVVVLSLLAALALAPSPLPKPLLFLQCSLLPVD